jgi:hypothetical protein
MVMMRGPIVDGGQIDDDCCGWQCEDSWWIVAVVKI